MAEILLSVGSNVEKEKNISAGLVELGELFQSLQCSSIYETQSAGFVGDNFYNLVVSVQTSMNLAQVSKSLKDLEFKFGRDFSTPRFSAKTLDVDILCFDQLVGQFHGVELPRPEILHSSYVLFPLAELVPNAVHPSLNVTFKELADSFAGQSWGIKKILESKFVQAV